MKYHSVVHLQILSRVAGNIFSVTSAAFAGQQHQLADNSSRAVNHPRQITCISSMRADEAGAYMRVGEVFLRVWQRWQSLLPNCWSCFFLLLPKKIRMPKPFVKLLELL
jgi:hypothetical protein